MRGSWIQGCTQTLENEQDYPLRMSRTYRTDSSDPVSTQGMGHQRSGSLQAEIGVMVGRPKCLGIGMRVVSQQGGSRERSKGERNEEIDGDGSGSGQKNDAGNGIAAWRR